MKGIGECNTEGEEVNRELLKLLFVIIKILLRLKTKNSLRLLTRSSSISDYFAEKQRGTGISEMDLCRNQGSGKIMFEEWLYHTVNLDYYKIVYWD